MPLYEYKCDRCGDVFEVIEKFSASPLQEHAGCGGHVERLLSAPALQFKGTGWYVTDYARNSGNGKSPAKGEGKGEGKSEAKSESKSETKSESKSETKSDSSKTTSSSTTSDKK
jgi:putative FmdB family regulatory protein